MPALEVPLSFPELVRQPGPAPSEDASLAARLRAGDESACEQLYLAHHDALWRFAYGYVRSRNVAEELVQEVLLHLWREREACDVRASALREVWTCCSRAVRGDQG